MHLSPSHVEEYLANLLGAPVTVTALTSLTDHVVTTSSEEAARRRSLKVYGYGQPVLVEYQVGGAARRAVLRTMAPNPFGHEYRADRAAGLLLSYDTFNDLPRHVRALDVGVIRDDSELQSIGGGGEFFLLTDYAEGTAYARDLQRLRDTGQLTDLDIRRVRCLAKYLADIHGVKWENGVEGRVDGAALYRRRIRDLLGSGEGILGLTDSYPPDFALAPPARLAAIETRCVEWRWRLKQKVHRLAQVHGDFHPFNVLFAGDDELWLLDRSRGAWGEPGDDVSCMAMNYLFFSLQRSGRLAPPFDALWDTFWQTYLDLTGDEEMLGVVAPFFAWRALVVASPVWYNVSDEVRAALFHFLENALMETRFDPDRVNEYLR